VVGNAARLVPAGNVDDLQIALRELLINDELRNQLGAQGREHILQQLSWDCVGKKIEHFYYQVLDRALVRAQAEGSKMMCEQVSNAHH